MEGLDFHIGISFSGSFEYNNRKPTKLQMPVQFWTNKGLCGYYLLSVPKMSTNWMVKLELIGEKLYMTEGFYDFCQFFKVVRGSQIHLVYSGNRTFVARIDSCDGLEIVYERFMDKSRIPRSVIDADFPGHCISVCVLNSYNKNSISLGPRLKTVHDQMIGSSVKLKVGNECEWLVKYDRDSRRLFELEDFMSSLEVKWCNPILFTYIGDDYFIVKLFRSCGVEDIYLRDYYKRVEKSNSSSINELDEQKIFHCTLNQKFLNKNRELAVLKLNAYAYPIQPIFVSIEPRHINTIDDHVVMDFDLFNGLKISSDDKFLWFVFGQLEFCLQITWFDEKISFSKGWKKFSEELDLKIGDVIVIQPLTNSMRFQTCVWTYEDSKLVYRDPENPLIGNTADVSFISIVNTHTLQEGIIRVPFVLRKEFKKLVIQRLQVRLKNGSIFGINISNNAANITGLGKLFEHVGVEEDNVLHISCTKILPWSLNIFNSNGIEMELSKPAICEINAGIAEEEITTGASMVVSGDINYHSFMSDDAIIDTNKRRKLENDSKITVNSMESTLAGDFVPGFKTPGLKTYEVTIMSSHVDNKTNGIYLSKELCNSYKCWRDKTFAKVMVGTKTWDIRMNIKKSVCRFGKGWNEFVTGNGLEEGMRMKYSLLQPSEKLFVAEFKSAMIKKE